MTAIKPYLAEQKTLFESYLKEIMLKPSGDFAAHVKAMRYSLFAGGKRVRPILCLAAARCISDAPDIDSKVLPIAGALEMIHTYSLIHDDLPAMDDDDLRRGTPTNHVEFGEAAAILAGDGLLTLAFELLSKQSNQAPETLLQIIQCVAHAAGSHGMVGGQSLDMIYEGKDIPYETLKTIHRSKTGALISASIISGALAAQASRLQIERLQQYGDNIGLAFQIVDDLLDIESTTEELGKPVGSDVQGNKSTYPALFGIKQSKVMAREAINTAIDSLDIFNHQADPLRGIALYIVERKK